MAAPLFNPPPGQEPGGVGLQLIVNKKVSHFRNLTNRLNKGWTSVDRSTEATLILTVPRSDLGHLHRI